LPWPRLRLLKKEQSVIAQGLSFGEKTVVKQVCVYLFISFAPDIRMFALSLSL
jgi:hypothetical protein